MNNETNHGYDEAGYDRDLYQHNIQPFYYNGISSYCDIDNDEDIGSKDISNANNLYDAYLKAKQGSSWKPTVQMYQMFYLDNIRDTQKQLRDGTWAPHKSTTFIMNERGKQRVIHGGAIGDRVVEHSLNDVIVMPSIRKYLIYDNGASIKGRGIDFTRSRVVEHLRNFYSHYGNDGYVLLIDFSKYYDNIQHKLLLDQFEKYIDDEMALWLIKKIISKFKVDVSYMTDEEYEHCLDDIFNSIDYLDIDPMLLTGEKFMDKHLDIGNQTSQSAGILYPSSMDNYIKIVRQEKYYDRYMDDGLVVHHSKEHLQKLFDDIVDYSSKVGMIINTKKTRIAKLNSYWRFLQIQYTLTDTGKIIRRINPQRLYKQKSKMKKLVNVLSEKDYHDWMFAWLNSQKKYMNRQQVKEIVALYYDLGGK